MKTLIGHCNTTHEAPVVGKLIFPERGDLSPSRGACLAVLNARLPLPEETDVVGAIRLCEQSDPLQSTQSTQSTQSLQPLPDPSYPVLTLSELSPRYHGQIALLDPRQATLFVSPDLATVNRYAHALRPTPLTAAEQSPLARSLIISSADEMLRAHGDGWLLSVSEKDGRDPDALYDHCCEVADRAAGAPVTVILPWDRQASDPTALSERLRALFRSAVYGRFSLLIRGPVTEEDCARCLKESHRAFCELESEGREFNGYIPKGILIDTPLALMTDLSLRGLDLLCFDLPRLLPLLTGQDTAAEDPDPAGEIADLLCRFADRHPRLRRTAILPDAGRILTWDPLLSALKAEEVFLPFALS